METIPSQERKEQGTVEDEDKSNFFSGVSNFFSGFLSNAYIHMLLWLSWKVMYGVLNGLMVIPISVSFCAIIFNNTHFQVFSACKILFLSLNG